jgi:hypothetical protein
MDLCYPVKKKKDIVKHCQDKADEYRKLSLSILDAANRSGKY